MCSCLGKGLLRGQISKCPLARNFKLQVEPRRANSLFFLKRGLIAVKLKPQFKKEG